jgi:GMP synthase-like glutamine amidotransferase
MDFKIGVLQCGHVNEKARKVYGDYPKVFGNLLKSSFSRLFPWINVQIEYFPVFESHLPNRIHEFSAFLITGSKYDAYKLDIPWIKQLDDFIKQVTRFYPSIRWLGICFGHQMIAQAYGSKVTKNPNGWEIGRIETTCTEAGKALFGKSQVYAQSMHQDIVVGIPEGFELLCSSKKASIQGLLKPNHILTVQFHPEYPPGIIDYIIQSTNYFAQDLVSETYSTLYLPTDGDCIFEKMVRFLVYNDSKL